jgi:hypothetical protein
LFCRGAHYNWYGRSHGVNRYCIELQNPKEIGWYNSQPMPSKLMGGGMECISGVVDILEWRLGGTEVVSEGLLGVEENTKG